ncbi:MAG: Uma2 family endonuclease [Thermomicrobiales bacterium]
MATTTTITLEELERLPEDECGEVIRGEMLPVSPVGMDHGDIVGNLLIPLKTAVRAQRTGFVGIEVGFVLRRDPLVVLAPDIAFIRSDRLPPPERRQSFFHGPPDLAVEVVSPSQSAPEAHDKVLLYLDAGTPLVWVVHPQQRTVTVYTPDRTARILGETDTLDGGEVLPGFTLALSEVFA